MNPADDKQTPAIPVVGAGEPMPAATPATGTRWADRARAIGLWARDTGLGITGFLIVLIVAIAGWSASFIGLHQFGIAHMGFTSAEAWLVPITFDGAAGGLSLVVFRASIHGRSATLWRLLIIVFTGLSSWINWVHIDDMSGRWIACYMPPAAVILFEGLMSEARAAFARRGGRERPRVHPLRWIFDRRGTTDIYRSYVLGIELPEQLQKAAANLSTETPESATAEAAEVPQSTPPERHEDAPQGAPVAELERHSDTPQSAPGAPQTPATERHSEPSRGAPEAPRNDAPERHESATKAAPKAPRKAPPKRHPGGTRGAAKDAIRALYDEHGRRPLESEMVETLKKIRCPHTSRQFANKLRAEIEKDHPELAALGSDNVRPLTGS